MSDQPDTRPLVLFAVEEEAAHFKDVNVETVICGMGKQNAAASIKEILARRRPRFVITSGFAGGLNEALRNGDVVGDWDADFPLSSSLANCGVKRVLFHCAARVTVTREEKRSLRTSTNMDAVEMESAVIREICRGKYIPSATIRVVSDSAADDLPLDFNQLMNADHTMNFAKLAGALIKAPWKIPKLIQFSGRVKFAAKELGRVLRELLKSADASAKP
jgi:nucleoside phosphorylase